MTVLYRNREVPSIFILKIAPLFSLLISSIILCFAHIHVCFCVYINIELVIDLYECLQLSYFPFIAIL